MLAINATAVNGLRQKIVERGLVSFSMFIALVVSGWIKTYRFIRLILFVYFLIRVRFE